MKWVRIISLVLPFIALILASIGCATEDTTPPSKITNLVKTTADNVNTPTFVWKAAIDHESGVAGYQVRIDEGAWVLVDASDVPKYTYEDPVSDGGHTFSVKAVDGAGHEGTVVSLYFICDATAPVIYAVGSSGITITPARVMWTTNEPSTSQVQYGLTTDYGLSTTLDSNLVTSHSVNVTGLSSFKTYHYRVKSRDAFGNETTSDDGTFGAPQDTAEISILSHSSYLSTGTYCVVGEVKNNSSNKMSLVKITATFYNSANVVVGTASNYTEVDILVPNQKSPFEMIVLDEAISALIDHYSLAVSANGEEPYRSFTILSQSSSVDSSGHYHVVGEVKNTGSQTMDYVEVVGTFYDSAGKVVATHSTFTEPHTLAPGESAPFDVMVSRISLSAKVSSYELQVQA